MITRNNNPYKFPIRIADGDFETPCPFGVLKNSEFEDIPSECPVCGPDCTCGCLAQLQIAGIGGPTCRACVYHVQILNEEVICYNPAIPQQISGEDFEKIGEEFLYGDILP